MSTLSNLSNYHQQSLTNVSENALQQKCLQLCQSFIGGSWRNAKSTEQIHFTKLTILVFRIQLDDTVSKVKNILFEPKEEEPRDLVIKFMNPTTTHARLAENVVISTIMSECAVTPRVYGIFKGGFISKFIQHIPFGFEHQQNLKHCKSLARLIAKIHLSKSVPIQKDNPWPLESIDHILTRVYSHVESFQKLLENLKLIELLEGDLRDEFRDLKFWLKQANSPKVFSHNKLLGSNIFISNDSNLYAIDFSYSTYNSRAFDLAGFFVEDLENVTKNAKLENFVQNYIEAADEIVPGYSTKPENSATQIIREIRIHLLLHVMYRMALKMAVPPEISNDSWKDSLSYVEKQFKKYLDLKRRLIADQIVQPIKL